MLRNDFQTAIRNLWKHKTFSFINIIGLTIGLVSFILISLFVFDELMYDSHHKNINSIYRVVENKTSAEGMSTRRSGTGYLVSAGAKTGFPEIKDVARISTYWRPEVRPGDHRENVFHEDFIAANQGFLNVFSFPLIYGDRSKALTEPKSVILTEETARKYFGTSDVISKLLFFDSDPVPYHVTGVFKDLPVNSSISFNLLVSEASIMSIPEAKEHFESDWTSGAFATYFLVNPNTDVPALNNKLDKLIATNHKADPGVKSHVELQALKDVHFYSSDIEGNSGRKGSIVYVYVFLIIAFFIIFIACINYMNLSTARFTNRGKEIAVRKVSGASRPALIRQFLTETFLVTIVSVFLSLVTVYYLLPPFNLFTGKQLALDIHTDYRIWTGIFLLIAIVTLVAGLYPALFQSGLNPLSLLKSKIQPGKGSISLRKSLVVFQFMISIVLIAATLIIYDQMQYVNNKDMGFDKEKLVVIDINSGFIRRSAATVKEEFLRFPQVKSVSVTSTVPGAWKTIPIVKVNTDNSNPASGKDMYYFGVDGQFLSTYDIKLVKGRNFHSLGNADSSAVLINETAAKDLGITEAQGQQITIQSVKFDGDNRSQVEKPFNITVVGIVKDFNFQSLHEPIAPMVIGYDKTLGISFGYLTVKLNGGANLDATMDKLNAVLRKIDQAHLFEYHFLDKQWEALYREDKVRQTVFLVVAMLAIFIATLGLLGLTIYAAEQRVKEIGVRKVLGASASGIVVMLSRDILKLVVIAAIIASPIAWFFMNRWLEDFAYRISVNGWHLVLSALAAVIIAVSTISIQVIKAALANPVKTLRSE